MLDLVATFVFAHMPRLPSGYCLPPWYYEVLDWARKWGNRTIHAPQGCQYNPITGDVPCDPEKLRRDAEGKLRALGLYRRKRLSLDAYSLARNLTSEVSTGTPSERAAIGLAAIHRARAARQSVTQNLLYQGRYGKQIGNKRPASTRQDPRVQDFILAQAILEGRIKLPTHGAWVYFDRSAWTDERAQRLYDRWVKGWGFDEGLMWVGHVPGIRPGHLALFREDPNVHKTAQGQALWRRAYDAGRAAIVQRMNTPPPAPDCAPPGILALVGGLVGGYPAMLAIHRAKLRGASPFPGSV